MTYLLKAFAPVRSVRCTAYVEGKHLESLGVVETEKVLKVVAKRMVSEILRAASQINHRASSVERQR